MRYIVYVVFGLWVLDIVIIKRIEMIVKKKYSSTVFEKKIQLFPNISNESYRYGSAYYYDVEQHVFYIAKKELYSEIDLMGAYHEICHYVDDCETKLFSVLMKSKNLLFFINYPTYCLLNILEEFSHVDIRIILGCVFGGSILSIILEVIYILIFEIKANMFALKYIENEKYVLVYNMCTIVIHFMKEIFLIFILIIL